MDSAHLPRPTSQWGHVILEQEGSSVLKRSDEPRPGDIAAFYDTKLKGKKGLSSYTQNVGSVEEPLVGIVSESETKKHKLRVLQVERGVPEEVSYRCDDIKSGRVVVSPHPILALKFAVPCCPKADLSNRSSVLDCKSPCLCLLGSNNYMSSLYSICYMST